MHTTTTLLSLALAATAAAKGVWTTPHDSYSSSIGVLGCKINTNRVAYWPGSVDCNNLCIKLSYGGRSVHLLRIDQSGGAYDISYDAWNYLQTGQSAATAPIAGGTVAMEYEEVDASECAGLIHTPGAKLPLSAANSINFLASCLAQPNSWVAKNHVLYNIADAICSLGFDEECKLDLAVSNQPSCPHTLGLTTKLTTAPVYNILYQTGKLVVAGTGEAAPDSAKVAVVNTAEEPAAEVKPAPAEATSASPQPSPTAGVFFEVSSSQTPAPAQSSTAAAAAEAPTTTSSGTSSPAVSSAAEAPTTTMTRPAAYYNQTTSAGSPGPKASTTLSVVTVSTSQSAPSSSASGPPTLQGVNAAHSAASVPVLALASSIILCSIFGAF